MFQRMPVCIRGGLVGATIGYAVINPLAMVTYDLNHHDSSLGTKEHSITYSITESFSLEFLPSSLPVVFLSSILVGFLYRYNYKLKQSRDEAERANRHKSEFLASMSHDLRTPLNAILGFSNAILSGDLPESKYEEYLADINLSGAHLLDLINDILDVSRLESENIEFNPRVFSLEEQIEEVNAILSVQLKDKDIVYELINSSENDKVFIDRYWINRVYINILGNAIKFTPEGGKITTQILTKSNDSLEVRITDTGIGINPEKIKTMTKAFIQVESDPYLAKTEGVGLGLYTSERFLGMNGSKLTIESELGVGTTVSYLVPRAK